MMKNEDLNFARRRGLGPYILFKKSSGSFDKIEKKTISNAYLSLSLLYRSVVLCHRRKCGKAREKSASNRRSFSHLGAENDDKGICVMAHRNFQVFHLGCDEFSDDKAEVFPGKLTVFPTEICNVDDAFFVLK